MARRRIVVALLVSVAALGTFLVTGIGAARQHARSASLEGVGTASPALSSSRSGTPLKVGWLLFGPKNDGGFAEVHWNAIQAVNKALGSKVKDMWTDNVPFSNQATQIAERYIAQGAKLLIDTGAIGDLFLKVCAKHPKIHCIEQYYIGKLPQNVTNYYLKFWKLEYVLGMAAGMMTKSNTIGFVGNYQIPLVKAVINSWALGCQSVNPKCKVRVIWINSWYDPPKSSQATNSLINAGADVVRSWTSDPGYCQVAEKRGVRAEGLYFDWRQFCPKANIISETWNFNSFFVKEVKLELAHKWTGGRNVILDIGHGPGLGHWGAGVPKQVISNVEGTYTKMQHGLNVFKGPIYDQKGKLRVAAGKTLPESFLYAKWNWLVRGVGG